MGFEGAFNSGFLNIGQSQLRDRVRVAPPGSRRCERDDREECYGSIINAEAALIGLDGVLGGLRLVFRLWGASLPLPGAGSSCAALTLSCRSLGWVLRMRDRAGDQCRKQSR